MNKAILSLCWDTGPRELPVNKKISPGECFASYCWNCRMWKFHDRVQEARVTYGCCDTEHHLRLIGPIEFGMNFCDYSRRKAHAPTLQNVFSRKLFRVRVVRSCRIAGKVAEPGVLLSLKLDEAVDAVAGERCEAIDAIPVWAINKTAVIPNILWLPPVWTAPDNWPVNIDNIALPYFLGASE